MRKSSCPKILRALRKVEPRKSAKVALLIPVYNEPPDLVIETACAAKQAVSGYGDVFVLDDSTKGEIKEGIDRGAKTVGYKVFRRGSRRGYKAGALNDWLKRCGDDYDYVMILDADQRPIPTVLDHVLPFFTDDKVAYVQVPQYYSDLKTRVSLAAYIQQIPFLRVVMRARHYTGSAFSLGSGTIFRVKALKEIGGFYEWTVTEDVHTSLLLNERGLRWSILGRSPGMARGSAQGCGFVLDTARQVVPRWLPADPSLDEVKGGVKAVLRLPGRRTLLASRRPPPNS